MKYLKTYKSNSVPWTTRDHELVTDLFILKVADEMRLRRVSNDEFEEIYEYEYRYKTDSFYTDEVSYTNNGFTRIFILLPFSEGLFKDSIDYLYIDGYIKRLGFKYKVEYREYGFKVPGGRKSRDWVHLTLLIENKK